MHLPALARVPSARKRGEPSSDTASDGGQLLAPVAVSLGETRLLRALGLDIRERKPPCGGKPVRPEVDLSWASSASLWDLLA
jgi:hypothetical protein